MDGLLFIGGGTAVSLVYKFAEPGFTLLSIPAYRLKRLYSVLGGKVFYIFSTAIRNFLFIYCKNKRRRL